MYLKVLFVIIVAYLFKNILDYLRTEIENEKTSSSSSSSAQETSLPRVLTQTEFDELVADTSKLHLAILGSVYDVSKGEKHYKPGGSYDFFVGRDASRAYVTGDFKNDLNDQIDDLSDTQIADIFNWKKFYDETYTFVGLLEGRFYDRLGAPTAYLKQAEEKKKLDLEAKNKNLKFNERFPPCNSEWTQEKGLVKLWCTPESGGVKRSWPGLPRLVLNPNSNTESCACVSEADLKHPNVKEYANCDAKSTTCNNPTVK
jgi:hypothetical protein